MWIYHESHLAQKSSSNSTTARTQDKHCDLCIRYQIIGITSGRSVDQLVFLRYNRVYSTPRRDYCARSHSRHSSSVPRVHILDFADIICTHVINPKCLSPAPQNRSCSQQQASPPVTRQRSEVDAAPWRLYSQR